MDTFIYFLSAGIVLLSVVISVVVVVVSACLWLHYHPEDREYLTTEVMMALVMVVIDRCGITFDNYCQRREQQDEAQLENNLHDVECMQDITDNSNSHKLDEVENTIQTKSLINQKRCEGNEAYQQQYDITKVNDL